MKTVATILNQDGTTKTVDLEWPEEPSYQRIAEFMAEVFGPGVNFEHVSVLKDDARADMFVDEMGSYNDKYTRNEAATTLYRANWLKNMPNTEPETLVAIKGPAVIFNRRIWF